MSKGKPQMGKLTQRKSMTQTYEFDVMQNIKPPEKSFGQILYDSENGTILLRTPKSWCEIITFYTIFYLCLAAFCVVCLKGLMYTIDENVPKWRLDASLIGTNPGLGFRPIAENVDQGSLIWYDSTNKAQIRYWVKLIDKFLDTYTVSHSNQKICDFDSKPSKKQVCRLDVDNFGECGRNHSYGYKNSSPCIFLKLNRIYGWEPEYYNDTKELPEEMPEGLKEHIKSLDVIQRNQVWVSCQGEDGSDKEILGDVEYFPTRGFPSYFYPYLNVKNYVSPLVAVKFRRPDVNQIINIECRTWAKNIEYSSSKRDRKGSIHIELMIDTHVD
jgi:sodium/potassium-transporting ATPase subunit beta